MTAHQLETDGSGDLSSETGWRSESECRKHPTRWWFAGGHRETLDAKAICGDCAVQAPCLEFALARPDLLGIWAATTPNERTAVRRSRRPRTLDASGAAPTSSTVEPSDVRPPVEPAVTEIDLTAPDLPAADLPPVDITASRLSVGVHRIEREPIRRGGGRRSGGGRERVSVVVDELLTPAEAAHKLGVTPNTVTRWSRAGKISAIQTMGGHRRFRRSEIERLLQAASVAAT